MPHTEASCDGFGGHYDLSLSPSPNWTFVLGLGLGGLDIGLGLDNYLFLLINLMYFKVTRIYACATMWHEAREEMLEMLKSIFRIDSDYSSRRIARLYMDVKDPDFYEWETHIFFDNCFEMDKEEGEMKVNEYVIQLCELMDVAASRHFKKKVRVKLPTKIPTPYGGQLIWTLPGKTNVVVHLKDVKKIRIKKRWSQIMYMYYLLGYKIMEEKKNYSGSRLDTRAENTFLLALDGDIDFQPNAVLRLVDMMKRNKVRTL